MCFCGTLSGGYSNFEFANTYDLLAYFCIFPSQACFHRLPLSSNFFQEHDAFTVVEKEFTVGLMPDGAWKVLSLKHLLF